MQDHSIMRAELQKWVSRAKHSLYALKGMEREKEILLERLENANSNVDEQKDEIRHIMHKLIVAQKEIRIAHEKNSILVCNMQEMENRIDLIIQSEHESPEVKKVDLKLITSTLDESLREDHRSCNEANGTQMIPVSMHKEYILIRDRLFRRRPHEQSNIVKEKSEFSLECGICVMRYSDINHPMLIIPCQHTICKRCVSKVIACPFCRSAIESKLINKNIMRESNVIIIKTINRKLSKSGDLLVVR